MSYQTVQNAARILHVPERAIRHAVDTGKIRIVVTGGGPQRLRYLINWDDTSEWAQTRECRKS